MLARIHNRTANFFQRPGLDNVHYGFSISPILLFGVDDRVEGQFEDGFL